MAAKLIISTAPADAARKLAATLVGERLVACATVLEGARSTYRWKGAVEEAVESVILMKTVEELVERAVSRLRELHPYEVPEAVVLPIEGGLEDYLRWIEEETG